MKRVFIYLVLLMTVGYAERLIEPIPLTVEYDREKALLGKKLFSDPILSRNRTISCEHCHHLNSFGVDNLRISVGTKEGVFNSPTVFNSNFNFRQFWDGRVHTLEEQVTGPIENPIEMNLTIQEAVERVEESYGSEFNRLFLDGVTKQNITSVLAEFEKALFTPNSKFDRFLRGDKKALNKQEREGFQTFKKKGCISCHQGVNVGGNMFQKFGAIVERGSKEFGRFNITKREDDKFVFKVPSLRNVEKTYPYFHNGSISTLKEAVILMGYHQLGRRLTEKDIADIIAFLKTLTGEQPEILQSR